MIADCVIPARMASTRLPGKPLLRETGKYLVQHVYERACEARLPRQVIVATDDARIAQAVEGFGGRAVMTRGDHASGTDRVAEVARTVLGDADIIINVQGDEPEIEPTAIDQLARLLIDHPSAAMATLATPITDPARVADPACVKVVCDAAGRALYFSRAAIPHPRAELSFATQELLSAAPRSRSSEASGRPLSLGRPPHLQHLGLYAYRREFLLHVAELPPSPLEQCEKLEQLRVLEAGFAIQVGLVARAAPGIDTAEQYAAFVARWKARYTGEGIVDPASIKRSA